VDERTAALRHYSAGSVVDLMPRLPHRTAPDCIASPGRAGQKRRPAPDCL
jgi:hypothetical protein